MCRSADQYSRSACAGKCTESVLLRLEPRLASMPALDNARKGLWLGVLGVAIFALSIPMTRLAERLGRRSAIAGGVRRDRPCGVAGLLAAALSRGSACAVAAAAPLGALAATAAGVVFGWPLFLGLAVLHVDAIHASVVTGVLPLATAAIGALWLRQRPSIGFWACALGGALLVAAFAAWKGGARLTPADGLLLLAVISAAAGYVSGARLSSDIAPQQVISWALVISLPLDDPDRARHLAGTAGARVGLARLRLCRAVLDVARLLRAGTAALAIGGTVRVSQVQLLQPFASMLFAVPILGESLDAATVAFALAVMVTVAIGRRMPIGIPSKPRPPAGVSNAISR